MLAAGGGNGGGLPRGPPSTLDAAVTPRLRLDIVRRILNTGITPSYLLWEPLAKVMIISRPPLYDTIGHILVKS